MDSRQLSRLWSILKHSPFEAGTGLDEDWENVRADVEEAIRAGREPEDVQAERHLRERAEHGLD